MLKEYGEKLSKLIELKQLKRKLERDLNAILAGLTKKSDRLESLRNQLNKEQVDVEKLERTSLTALFYPILGSREQQHEKERQEMLSAQLLYQQAKSEVGFLEQEREILLKRLEELQNVDSDYELLFSKKEVFLSQSNPTIAQELMEFSEQIAKLNSEGKEIAEAVKAGNNVLSGLDQCIGSLKSAANWGTWDLLGGGAVITAFKHSNIDDAKGCLNAVQFNMNRFKREMADVKKIVPIQIDIGKMESFIDLFFDNLITDWIVQKRITGSLERVQSARSTIDRAVRDLNGFGQIIQSKIIDWYDKRTKLIEQD